MTYLAFNQFVIKVVVLFDSAFDDIWSIDWIPGPKFNDRVVTRSPNLRQLFEDKDMINENGFKNNGEKCQTKEMSASMRYVPN